MERQLGVMTEGPIWGRLNKAYASLTFIPERSDRSRAKTLDRYGPYEVRLVELLRDVPTEDQLFWLELYCHVTKSSLDSYRCDNLDDAETAAEYLVSRAKQLQSKSE